MNRAKPSAPSRQPLIPGSRCPAERTNKSSDPLVTVTLTGQHSREGRRTCGRCGRPNVVVKQNWGDHHSAWRYEWHAVPLNREKGDE